MVNAFVAVGAPQADAIMLCRTEWFCQEPFLKKILVPSANVALLFANGEIKDKPSINDHDKGEPKNKDSSSSQVVAAVAEGTSHIGAQLAVFERSLSWDTNDEASRYSESSHTASRTVSAHERDFVRAVLYPALIAVMERRECKVVVARHMHGDSADFTLDLGAFPSAARALAAKLAGFSGAGKIKVEGSGHWSSAGISGSNKKSTGPLFFLKAVAEALPRSGVSQALTRALAAIRSALAKLPGATSKTLRFYSQAQGLFSEAAAKPLVGGKGVDEVGDAVKLSVADYMAAEAKATLGNKGTAMQTAVEEAAWKPFPQVLPTMPKLPDVIKGKVENKVTVVSGGLEQLIELVGEKFGVEDIDFESIKADATDSAVFGDSDFLTPSGKEDVAAASRAGPQLARYLVKQLGLQAKDREMAKEGGAIYVTLKFSRAKKGDEWVPTEVYVGSSVQAGKSSVQALESRFGTRAGRAEKGAGGDALTSSMGSTIAQYKAGELNTGLVKYETFFLPLAAPSVAVPGGASPVVHYVEALLISLLRPYNECINVLFWTFTGVLSHEQAVVMGSEGGPIGGPASNVRGGVTLAEGTDAQAALKKLENAFGEIFTLKDGVIKATGDLDDVDLGKLKTAMQALGIFLKASEGGTASGGIARPSMQTASHFYVTVTRSDEDLPAGMFSDVGSPKVPASKRFYVGKKSRSYKVQSVVVLKKANNNPKRRGKFVFVPILFLVEAVLAGKNGAIIHPTDDTIDKAFVFRFYDSES